MLRRSPFSPVQSALYALNYVLMRVLWRAQIRGRFPIPPGQGAVIVCNHRCPLDPSFIADHGAPSRPLDGGQGILRIPGLPPAPASLRGDSRQSRGRRYGRHEGGHSSGRRAASWSACFPKDASTRPSRLLLPGRPGAAMIALKARAPVVPCYIHGAPYDGTTLGCLLMPASRAAGDRPRRSTCRRTTTATATARCSRKSRVGCCRDRAPRRPARFPAAVGRAILQAGRIG